MPTDTVFRSESPTGDPLTFLLTQARISVDFSESKHLCIREATTSVDKGARSYIIFGKWHIEIDIEIDNGAYLLAKPRIRTNVEPWLIIKKHWVDINLESSLLSSKGIYSIPLRGHDPTCTIRNGLHSL